MEEKRKDRVGEMAGHESVEGLATDGVSRVGCPEAFSVCEQRTEKGNTPGGPAEIRAEREMSSVLSLRGRPSTRGSCLRVHADFETTVPLVPPDFVGVEPPPRWLLLRFRSRPRLPGPSPSPW